MVDGPPHDIFCVFAKPPRPGQTKTRLAATIGDDAAARLAHAFLLDTLEGLTTYSGAQPALATTEPFPSHVPMPEGLPVFLQGEGDLGARIERVMRQALEVAPHAFSIGADAPGLPLRLLKDARHALRTHDAVLGPAADGGFYLLGLKHCPPGLFAGLPWSCQETFRATLERLRQSGLQVALLDPWFDVDFAEDLQPLKRAIQRGEVRAERTRALLHAMDLPARRPGIAIIMPALNEAERIVEALEALRDMPGIAEVLVVDGGSSDGTPELARDTGIARVLSAPRGRASQMNTGANAATAPVLLFLHVDVRLPREAASYVETALRSPRTVGGAFRIWTVDDTGEGRMNALLHLADIRSRYSGIPYGDQAIFVRRADFHAIGGFPDLPLMEDLEFSLRLRKRGQIHTVACSVRVSGRRFIARPIYYTVLTNIFPILYHLGISAHALARLWKAIR